jgi:hypothetical protein
MPSQKITIIKIAGASGKKILEDFSHFIKAGQTDPGEYDGVQITSLEHQERLKKWIEALRHHNFQPPIVFYTEYVDFWSGTNIFDQIFPEFQSSSNQFWFQSTEIRSYSLPDEDRLLNNIKKRCRARNKSIPQESIWFWTILRHAVQAYAPLVTDATLVVIRELLGGLVEDTEIKKSLVSIPKWMNEASSS